MWLAWTRSWITDGSTGPPVGGAPEVACTFILLFHEKYLTGRAYPKDAAEGNPLGDRASFPPPSPRVSYIVPLSRRTARAWDRPCKSCRWPCGPVCGIVAATLRRQVATGGRERGEISACRFLILPWARLRCRPGRPARRWYSS